MIIILIALIIYVIGMIIRHLLPTNNPAINGGRDVVDNRPPKTIDDVPFNTCVPPISHDLINKHHGQRKLFIAEVELLTMAILKNPTKRDVYFVYAGSAPGIHIGRMLEMFPMVTFILVDPNEFNISDDGVMINYPQQANDNRIVYLSSSDYESYPSSSPKKVRGIDGTLYDRGRVPKISKYADAILSTRGKHRVYIIEELMTISLAKELHRLSLPNEGAPSTIILMSDIRTNSGEENPTNGDLLWNMAQMFVWVANLKPTYYSHKHRPILDTPVIEDYMLPDIIAAKELGLDLIDDPHLYLGGDVYLQAWTTRHSPETRLIGKAVTTPGVSGSSDESMCGYVTIPPSYHQSTSAKDGLLHVGDSISYPVHRIDPIEYDQKMLYHNRINRGTMKYTNCADMKNGIDECYDCCREANVWNNYYSSIGIIPTPSIIADSMISLSRWIVREPHGDMLRDIERIHKKKHKTKKNLHVHTKIDSLLSRSTISSEMVGSSETMGSLREKETGLTLTPADHHHPIYDPAN